MISVFIWIMLIIATERATELIVASKIFEPIRLFVKRWAYSNDDPPPDTIYQHFKVMIDYLMTCGYCVSVWVGGFFALFVGKYHHNIVINWLISLLFLHGMANLYHVVYELLRRGRVRSYDIMLKLDYSQNNLSDEDEAKDV